MAEILSKGFTKYGFGPGFTRLGNGEFLGIDTPVWIFLAVFLGGAYAWYQTPLGRHVIAIGAERNAAHSLGVATRRIPFLLYGASGLAAALGGAVGNLIDRGRFGAVVDFVDLHVWPIFNLADTAIVLGAVMLALGSLVDG